MADYYNRLGIAPDASAEAVRRAFRTRAKAVHPDAHPHLPAAERDALKRRFIALAQAYETLSDPERRARYDRQRRAEAGSRAHAASAARPHHGPRTQRPTGASSGARTAGSGRASSDPGEGLDDLLHDVEDLLGRFGLNLRQPFEELLEALLDWARAIYRQVMEALEASGEAGSGASTRAGAARENAQSHRGHHAGTAEAEAHAEGRSQGSRPHAARAAAAEEAALQAELDALKRRVRRGGAVSRGDAPGLDEELRRLKRRLGKTP